MEQADILIVDDNPEIREIIQILLSGEGYQVHEAANGHQALLLLKQASCVSAKEWHLMIS